MKDEKDNTRQIQNIQLFQVMVSKIKTVKAFLPEKEIRNERKISKQ